MYLGPWRNDALQPAQPATLSMDRLHHLMPASMASYLPIHRGESKDTEADDDSKQSFLYDERGTPVESLVLIRSRWLEWIILSLSVVATICAGWIYVTSAGITRPRDTRGLLKPNQYPGIDKFAVDLAHKGPAVIFPSKILHIDKVMPDTFHEPGPHVLLSPTDSMIYQWRFKKPKFSFCYIDAWAPPPDEPDVPPSKNWTASGTLNQIQVWNVTTPAESITSMSWNTRPERISLLGTVSWIPFRNRERMEEYQDGWQAKAPTPRFQCSGVHTFEIACDDCKIEFYQVFSEPPLAFDVTQL